MPRPGPRPYECIRRAWHSDAHQPLRGTLTQQILRVVTELHKSETRHKKEWQEKLPTVVLRAEEILYSKAKSEADYMDVKTLSERLEDAIDTMIRRNDANKEDPFMKPCVEAALYLGCYPRNFPRGQKAGTRHNSGNAKRVASVLPSESFLQSPAPELQLPGSMHPSSLLRLNYYTDHRFPAPIYTGFSVPNQEKSKGGCPAPAKAIQDTEAIASLPPAEPSARYPLLCLNTPTTSDQACKGRMLPSMLSQVSSSTHCNSADSVVKNLRNETKETLIMKQGDSPGEHSIAASPFAESDDLQLRLAPPGRFLSPSRISQGITSSMSCVTNLPKQQAEEVRRFMGGNSDDSQVHNAYSFNFCPVAQMNVGAASSEIAPSCQLGNIYLNQPSSSSNAHNMHFGFQGRLEPRTKEIIETLDTDNMERPATKRQCLCPKAVSVNARESGCSEESCDLQIGLHLQVQR